MMFNPYNLFVRSLMVAACPTTHPLFFSFNTYMLDIHVKGIMIRGTHFSIILAYFDKISM